ncbi:unnamed protein product [Clavelina lepadiformis]|uniref:Uncharacterized protein n=1 Tax=Clavelina lepadiformis TaxID=159417 RepID=A0ABP0GB57_CLALP
MTVNYGKLILILSILKKRWSSMTPRTRLPLRSANLQDVTNLCCIGVEPHLSRNPSQATWISRDGTAMRNWGGSDQEGYCACGITGTCSRKNDVCNCDLGGTAQRVDEGFLTDGNSLPVTELQFGDNGDRSESGWHTLGPLICSGSS